MVALKLYYISIHLPIKDFQISLNHVSSFAYGNNTTSAQRLNSILLVCICRIICSYEKPRVFLYVHIPTEGPATQIDRLPTSRLKAVQGDLGLPQDH